MTANLISPQIPFDTCPPDLNAGITRNFGQRHSSITKSCIDSAGDGLDSFLTRLAQISKDHELAKQATGPNSDEILAAADNPVMGLETEMSARAGHQREDLNKAKGLIRPDLISAAVFTSLENLGRYEWILSLGSATNMGSNLKNAQDLAALEALIARFGKFGSIPSGEMKAELGRLGQFLANLQTDNASSRKDESCLEELADRKSTKLPYLSQLIDSIVWSQEDLRVSYGVRMGQKGLGRGPLDPFDHLYHVAEKLAAAIRANGIDVNAQSPKPSLNQTVSTGTSGTTGLSERFGLPNQISLVLDAVKQIGGQPAQEKLSQNDSSSVMHMANNAQTAKSDSQGQLSATEISQNHTVNSKSSPFIVLKNTVEAAMTSNSDQRLGDETTQNQAVKNESPLAIKMAIDAQAAKVAIQGQQNAGEAVQNISVQNESSTVSKIIHDAQMTKEHNIKMDAAVGDEIGGKIFRVDVAANDSGLLNPQNHTAVKSFEAAFISKQNEKAQDSFRIQALDQIVRKAVIYIRNGHHEAKIDLKPDFLGHVRLQVTTENRIVTVKIMIEFGFVKDMVENSIHQLKADLQQHGLNVDKVEVAISGNSDENKHQQEKTEQPKARQYSNAGSNPEDREKETQKRPENSALWQNATATVDYFA